ncbi:MAG: hypothetical protein ABF290_17100, partial [Thiogranum sp.]
GYFDTNPLRRSLRRLNGQLGDVCMMSDTKQRLRALQDERNLLREKIGYLSDEIIRLKRQLALEMYGVKLGSVVRTETVNVRVCNINVTFWDPLRKQTSLNRPRLKGWRRCKNGEWGLAMRRILSDELKVVEEESVE